MKSSEIARAIEHTCLRAEARTRDIEQRCEEACQWGFVGVCVNPVHVPLCARTLAGFPVLVVSVVGFPLGASPHPALAAETRWCVTQGAHEIDMVIPLGAALDGHYAQVRDQVRCVVDAAGSAPVKAILETAHFDDDALRRVAEAALQGGAAYLKTSTGFGPGAATPHHVALLAEVAGTRAKVKAAGGIRTHAQARALLDAGATRLGTSGGVQVVQACADPP